MKIADDIGGLFSRKEVKHLLPGTVLKLKSIHPQQWTAAIHEHFLSSVQSMSIIEAKKKFLGNDAEEKI